MNKMDWTELIIKTFMTLLSEYMRKHSYDEAQEVLSRVSYDLSVHDPIQQSLISHQEPVINLSPLEEKALFRQLQGTAT